MDLKTQMKNIKNLNKNILPFKVEDVYFKRSNKLTTKIIISRFRSK